MIIMSSQLPIGKQELSKGWISSTIIVFEGHLIGVRIAYKIKNISSMRRLNLTYKSCNCVNTDMDGNGLVRRLYDRSNDVSSVRLANESLGNVPCRPNRDIFLKF